MEFDKISRLRKKDSLRKLVQETNLSIKNFVLPIFVVEGKNKKEEINLMSGIYKYSVDRLIPELEKIQELGILTILLFGVNDKKDFFGRYAYMEDGIVQKTIKKIKQTFPDLILITDVCLCGYTLHGHCGIVKIKNEKLKMKKYKIDNDKTLEVLSKIALSHAGSGADIVAPSSMTDGQVKVIRKNLDKNGFNDVAIMSYSAKFFSNFYGPFREILNSTPKFGDRKSYQINYCNTREALREIETDIREGADIVMVKPSLCYLDIIKLSKEKFNIPLAVFNVSGEYSMVKSYCKNFGIAKTEIEKNMVLEMLTGIKRAGADIIISYWAKEVANWLRSS